MGWGRAPWKQVQVQEYPHGVGLETAPLCLSSQVAEHRIFPTKAGFVSLRRWVLLCWLHQKTQNRCDWCWGIGDISVNLGLDETLYLLPPACSFFHFISPKCVWFSFPFNGKEYVNRFLRINWKNPKFLKTLSASFPSPNLNRPWRGCGGGRSLLYFLNLLFVQVAVMTAAT